MKEIATEIEGPKLELHESWAKLTSKSSIYLCNWAMKQLAEIMIRKATEGERRLKATKEIGKRIEMMSAYIKDKEEQELKDMMTKSNTKHEPGEETGKGSSKAKKRTSKK